MDGGVDGVCWGVYMYNGTYVPVLADSGDEGVCYSSATTREGTVGNLRGCAQ